MATVIDANTATMSGTVTGSFYVVNSNVTRIGTMTVTGNVKLILVDDKKLTLTGSDNNAGINVTGTHSLTIYDQVNGTCTMTAKGGGDYNDGAGIDGDGGTVSISDGVFALGGTDAKDVTHLVFLYVSL